MANGAPTTAGNARCILMGGETRMTPRAMAHAYLIHAYAEPLEWNVTIQDIADATGLANNRIGRILRAKGWFSRVRTNIMDYQGLRETA